MQYIAAMMSTITRPPLSRSRKVVTATSIAKTTRKTSEDRQASWYRGLRSRRSFVARNARSSSASLLSFIALLAIGPASFLTTGDHLVDQDPLDSIDARGAQGVADRAKTGNVRLPVLVEAVQVAVPLTLAECPDGPFGGALLRGVGSRELLEAIGLRRRGEPCGPAHSPLVERRKGVEGQPGVRSSGTEQPLQKFDQAGHGASECSRSIRRALRRVLCKLVPVHDRSSPSDDDGMLTVVPRLDRHATQPLAGVARPAERNDVVPSSHRSVTLLPRNRPAGSPIHAYNQ